MNMSEIERIESRIPIGMQLELDQLQRDRLVANAKHERSEYIAQAFRKLAGALKAFATQARREAGYDVSGVRLPQ